MPFHQKLQWLQKSSNCDKLLAVKIDTKLIFNNYIKDLCRKARSNLCMLGRITSYMGLGKKKLLNDFPLIWMFYSQSNDSKITRLHERCLRLIYSDKSSSYENYRKGMDQSLFIKKIFRLFNWSHGQRPWKILVNQLILSNFQIYHL